VLDILRYSSKYQRLRIYVFIAATLCLLLYYLVSLQYVNLLLIILALCVLEVSTFIITRHIAQNHTAILALYRVPQFPPSIVEKFYKHGYDPELGWVRKPNTSKIDMGKQYNIDFRGSRQNPGHEHLEIRFSTYGDSYTFCREVSDNETWQWHLAEMARTNVLNFGVGNYGLDQALLRMKRAYPKNPTPYVIMGVVPDTIARILSVWKHYNEYGNILAFKPRFVLQDQKLSLIPNIIDSKEKFFKIHKYLSQINTVDYFFEKKFKKEAFRFPYLISLLSNGGKLFLFMTKAFRAMFRKHNNLTYDILNHLIINTFDGSTVKQAERLYQDKDASILVEKIIDEFVSYSKQMQFTPILIIMPMRDDLWYIKKKYNFYKAFYSKLNNKIMTIDIADYLLSEIDTDKCFHRWHYNSRGNNIVAKAIFQTVYG